MEDADDAALSYAEVKMLATGNPMFKEKDGFRNSVTVANNAQDKLFIPKNML